MNKKRIRTKPLPQLNEKEVVTTDVVPRNSVAHLPRKQAEQLITAMVNRISDNSRDRPWIRIKASGKESPTFRFDPTALRRDLDGETITICGYGDNDDSGWLVVVRFLAQRRHKKVVRFEIQDHYNPQGIALMPLVT